MKELTEKNKKALKLMLADKGYNDVEIDSFGNIVQVRERNFLEKTFAKNADTQSGKIITTLTELASTAMGLDYDPNEIVKTLLEKWIKDRV